jgi:hypothetical protein
MIYPTDLLHPSPAPHFKTFKVFLICFSKCPSFSTIQSYTPTVALIGFFLKFKLNLLVIRVIIGSGSGWQTFSNPEISHLWHSTVFLFGYMTEWHH